MSWRSNNQCQGLTQFIVQINPLDMNWVEKDQEQNTMTLGADQTQVQYSKCHTELMTLWIQSKINVKYKN